MKWRNFYSEQMDKLAANKYVERVSNTTITYTDKFKAIFITEVQKGNYPRIIFQELHERSNRFREM